MEKALTQGERFFLNVHDQFYFLRKVGYQGDSFHINGVEFWISFYSHSKKKKVTVVSLESGFLDLYVETKNLMGWNKKRLNAFLGQKVKVQNISQLVKLIKLNKYLMEELL